MKRFVFLLLVIFAISAQGTHAQIMPVIDAAANEILEATHISQAVHYSQMIMAQAANLAQFVSTATSLATQLERTIQNLSTAKDIRSFDDFMDWYNRSLYMERTTLAMLENANITIGKKSYNFMDVAGMAGGIKDTYVDYWDREFTNEQRREMWLGLGLTPSNYAYVEPFRDDMRHWRQQAFSMDALQNTQYMQNMQRNVERQKRMAEDLLKPTEEKMGQNELLQYILESSMENNRLLGDIAMYQAMNMKLEAAKMYLDDAPYDAPPFAVWSKPGFRELK
jgi:hypothetical protein